jgi:hypothetical protein
VIQKLVSPPADHHAGNTADRTDADGLLLLNAQLLVSSVQYSPILTTTSNRIDGSKVGYTTKEPSSTTTSLATDGSLLVGKTAT